MEVLEKIAMPQDSDLPDLLLKPPQVAKMLGIHPQTVLEWLHAGKLPGIRLPGNAGWRIRKSELEAWLAKRASGQDPDAN